MGFLTLKETSKDKEYERYIANHISNVRLAFKEYGTELCEYLGANYDFVYSRISKHDESKFSCSEFVPYRMKFYPNDGESISEEQFNHAWLHHIHNNAHHPEHWIIPTKDGLNVLDMSPEYIVEMLCDWQSFKYTGKGNAYDFYYKVDKKEGLLSDATRKLVEIGLEIFKEE